MCYGQTRDLFLYGHVAVPGLLFSVVCVFFFQAEDGIRDLVRSRGLGDVYKRQNQHRVALVDQFVQHVEQLAHILEVQTGRRLVQDLSLIHI